MQHLGKVYHSKEGNFVSVVSQNQKKCPYFKNEKLSLRKSDIVYLDKTALYVQLIKLESRGECKYYNSIKVIYQILDDSIEREMESRKCFNDIKTSISKVVECFGGKENIPKNCMRRNEESFANYAY